jgi:tetratricopeptide (TPR) repeat protein
MNRWAGTLWLAATFLLMLPNALLAEVLNNDAVVTMVKSGLGEAIILEKVKISQGQYDLSVQGLVRLKESGVSEAIIKAMMEAAPPPAGPGTPSPQAVEQRTQDAISLYRQGKAIEAEAAFDRLLAEQPGDANLKVWKSLAILEQAHAKKDAEESGYKPLVVKAYTILQPLGRTNGKNPDWNYAMALAFWLNDRPTWAGRAARTALELRPNFAEPMVLLGDLAYDSDVQALSAPVGSARRETTTMWLGVAPRKEYERALAVPDLPAPLRAETLYKLGRLSADLLKKPKEAREYWERAVAADPGCRYGVMAGNRLKAGPAK